MNPPFDAVLKDVSLLPVVTVPNASVAEPLAHALMLGGFKAIEIVLRTPDALTSLATIKTAFPTLYVGAGTIKTVSDFQAAQRAGADFIISPCTTDALAEFAKAQPTPFIPGVQTVADVQRMVDHGFTHMKFFPAEISGGARLLTSLIPVFPDVTFCPTGGINEDNAFSYLSLPNVACVGGSWFVEAQRVQSNDWRGLETLARDTLASVFEGTLKAG